MKKRAFLIHGWGGYPEEGWRPWLKRELEERGFEVHAPSMPDTNYPKMKAWLSHLKKVVGIPDEQCYFVGHSLGAITILRYLEALPKDHKIGGAILIAGFTDTKIGQLKHLSEIQNFFANFLSFSKIKKHCGKFISIHSDNDPYVSLQYGEILHDKLSAEFIILHNMKHFSGDDGITKLPAALNAVLKLSNT